MKNVAISGRESIEKDTTVGMWLSLARALRSGRRGRWFESSHPDHSSPLWGE